MHIIVFTPEPSSKMGGQPLSTFEVCQYLVSQGNVITLLFIKAGDLLDKYQQFCVQTIKVDSFDIDPRKFSRSLILLIRQLLVVLSRIRGSHSSERTIIYTDTHKCCLLAYLMSVLIQCPTTFHIRQPVLKPMPLKYKLGVRSINQFITVSEYLKNSWIQEGNIRNIKNSNTFVIYNGVDLERFFPVQDEDIRHIQKQNQFNMLSNSRVVSYIGRLDEQKGLLTLLKAFSVVVKQAQHPVRLLLAGESVLSKSSATKNNYKKRLQKMVDDLGLRESVRFLGHVADPTSLYQISDLTILPSLYPEPFGRSVIESMACGVPVVASRLGGIPEILTGEFSQGLFESGSSNDLAGKILTWINWRSQDSNLGLRCRQHVATHFPISRTLKGIEEKLFELT
jgi:glycosyltransferase involved in cell wall biosynthesis